MFKSVLLATVVLVKALLPFSLGVQPAVADDVSSPAVPHDSEVPYDDDNHWPFPDDC